VLIGSLSLIWLHLTRGEVNQAAAVLADAGPLVQQDQCAALAPLLRAAAPRILVAQGRATGDVGLLRQAAPSLESAQYLAEQLGLGWLRLEALILRALIDDGLDDRDAAIAALAGALLDAFAAQAPIPITAASSASLVEPPSARELHLLDGHSTRFSTVRWTPGRRPDAMLQREGRQAHGNRAEQEVGQRPDPRGSFRIEHVFHRQAGTRGRAARGTREIPGEGTAA
jgi:hypothetical protein